MFYKSLLVFLSLLIGVVNLSQASDRIENLSLLSDDSRSSGKSEIQTFTQGSFFEIYGDITKEVLSHINSYPTLKTLSQVNKQFYVLVIQLQGYPHAYWGKNRLDNLLTSDNPKLIKAAAEAKEYFKIDDIRNSRYLDLISLISPKETLDNTLVRLFDDVYWSINDSDKTQILHDQKIHWPHTFIKLIPRSIFQFNLLNFIDLSFNPLVYVSPEIKQFSNIEQLHIIDSSLTYFPEEIAYLSKLQTLNLAYNKLLYLPDSISKLTYLRVLNVCSNQITTISAEVKNLTALEMLVIRDNPLMQTVDEIRGFFKQNLEIRI